MSSLARLQAAEGFQATAVVLAMTVAGQLAAEAVAVAEPVGEPVVVADLQLAPGRFAVAVAAVDRSKPDSC